MGDIIQVNELTKLYEKLLAVTHISFDVKEGEVFGFLGPNGAGKTTIIRMMVELTQPSSGTAWIDGYDVTKEPIHVFSGLLSSANTADFLQPSGMNDLPMIGG